MRRSDSLSWADAPRYDYELGRSDPANRPAIKKAQHLYMQDWNYERIFLVTGIPPSIFLALSKVWERTKQRVDNQVIERIRKEVVGDSAKELLQKGLVVSHKFMDRLIARGDEITVKDFKLVVDSMRNLHAITQLEGGLPTDISVYANMSPEQIQSYLDTQRQALATEHDSSMFAPRSDVPEELIVDEYVKGKDGELN